MNSELYNFHRSVVCNKRPARHDARTLKMARYTAALPTPPDEYALDGIPGTTPSYWLNNTLGDCTKAAYAGMVYSLSYAAGDPFVYTDDQVETMYEQCDGYVPGDSSTDQGSDGLTSLKYFARSGADGHAPKAYLSAALGNLNDAKIAARYLGGLYTGINLPTVWQGETVWDVSPAGVTDGGWAPGGWGGHMIYLKPSYNGDYIEVLTWAATYQLTWAAYAMYVDEPYSVVLADFKSPDGFDTAQLEADQAQVQT